LYCPILRLKPTKRKACHPFSTPAAHPGLGKAIDSGSERMATQFISTKTKDYRVPQDVCCITTLILAREALRSPVASLWQIGEAVGKCFILCFDNR